MKRLSIAVLGAAVVASLAVAPPAFADEGDIVTTAEAAAALRSTPGLLAQSDSVSTTVDADSAALATINGAVIDVPKDADAGVSLETVEGTNVQVELPNADMAGAARTVAPGTVAYPSVNGASNAVQTTETGDVRLLTIIDSEDAPTEYAYNITVPGGGRVMMLPEGGGAAVVDANENVVTIVPTPWARAADGTAVPTRFSTDGTRLIQHVDHHGAAYPVTADPVILGVFVAWWTLVRIASCVGGGVWGWISGGGNRWDQRMFQAFMGCASALGLAYLFRGR